MSDIKSLGNKQLSLYYEITNQKLNDIQLTITDDISNIFGQAPVIDFDTYTNVEKFGAYCEKYRSSIEQEKKELFLILKKKQKEIQDEIIERQTKMLKEIGIITPSMRVLEITHKMRGAHFQMFEEIIRYIKLTKKGQWDKRPKERIIMAPPTIIEKFENHGWIITILAKNLWPIAN